MTEFKVIECNLHDETEGTVVAVVETRWEAEQYVDLNEERANEGGYCLFIEGEDAVSYTHLTLPTRRTG